MSTCLNCREPTAEPVFHQGMMLCSTCGLFANRFLEGLQQQANWIVRLGAEQLRDDIVKGRLRPPPPDPDGTQSEPSVQEVLKTVLQLQERREAMANRKE